MKRPALTLALATVILTASPPTQLQAQHVTSPGAALELLRKGGSAEPAGRFLAQEGLSLSADELDSLADALTQIASQFESANPNVIERKKAVGSVSALEYSGSKRAAVRYTGSLTRLRMIVEQGRDKPVRSMALQAMLSVTDGASLVPYLVTLASADDPIADHAVSMLVRYTGADGREELRRLHRERKVIEPNAKELLSLIASANDW